jgi:hypothetical protein
VRGERKEVSSYLLSLLRYQGDIEEALAQKPGEPGRTQLLVSKPERV